MWRTVWSGAVALTLLVLVTGCAGAASEVKVGESDDGGQVTIGVGQVLLVELPGNPTTGFMWSAAKTPDFLTVLGEPDYKADSDLIGASGMIGLRFSAERTGTGTLELRYARPWESVQPQQVFTIDVTCR
ncbi:MAG: protease inhibitor I42 family protein [Coriobacteriia bacterium]|nr:protease inhibitor I42 family protein [Coriobacteriia bacterium]